MRIDTVTFSLFLTASAQLRPAPVSAFCQAQNVGEAAGQQQPNGGKICSSTVQGLIPPANKMISTLITEPRDNAQVSASQGFSITFKTNNFMTGNSVNLDNEFLLMPQTLENDMVQGSVSISLQQMTGNRAPQGKSVSFFKTSTTKANANGQATHQMNFDPNTDGQITTRGLHRLCTISAAMGGQPTLMAVAQRGAQDDCIRVNVVD